MNKKTFVILISLICLVGIAFFGLKSLKNLNSSPSNELPVAQYINAPKTFAGNTYSLTAQIDSQLAYDENSGRIIKVKTDDNSELPIFAPITLANFNPMVGQRYKFSIKIGGDGILTITNFKKI